MRDRLAKTAERTGWSQREIVEMAVDAFGIEKLPTKAEMVADLMKGTALRRPKQVADPPHQED